jgi:hypothetical protein
MMKRFLAATLAIATAATVSSTPAAAQQVEELKVSAGKAYKHKHSKLRLPATLAGVSRTTARSLSADLLDVSASYETPDGAEFLSLYVYRHVTGAVPVWFDRARWAIENRPDVYGTPVPAMLAPSFVPPGQQTASGLIATYAINKPPFRSTGIAILPFGEWLVKLRYSSRTLESASLATAMHKALAELDWPREIAPAPAASPLTDCPTPLAFSGEAKPVPASGVSTLMAALMGATANVEPKKEASELQAAVSWCRDAAVLTVGGVYRPNAATDRYLIALSDAGRGIFVQPDPATALLAESKPTAPSWLVAFIDLGAITNYQAQDRLPSPTQVIERLVRGPINSRVNTWGKTRNVDISPGAFGGSNGKAE